MHMKPVSMAILLTVLLACGSLAAANTLADPTRPANAALYSPARLQGTGHNSWVLNSTLIAADRRVAVINGEHVSEGESVGNATVIRIRKLEVLIQVAGKRINLKLLPDIVNILPRKMEH